MSKSRTGAASLQFVSEARLTRCYHIIWFFFFDFFFRFFSCLQLFTSFAANLRNFLLSVFFSFFISALRLTKRCRILSLLLPSLCKLYIGGFLIWPRRSFYQGNWTPSSVVWRRPKTHKRSRRSGSRTFPFIGTHWCRYFLFCRPPRCRDNRHTVFSCVSWFVFEDFKVTALCFNVFLPSLIYTVHIYICAKMGNWKCRYALFGMLHNVRDSIILAKNCIFVLAGRRRTVIVKVFCTWVRFWAHVLSFCSHFPRWKWYGEIARGLCQRRGENSSKRCIKIVFLAPLQVLGCPSCFNRNSL